MHDAVLFVVLALACYRVTRLVTTDKLTERFFDRIRFGLECRWYAKHGPEGSDTHFNSKLAYMLSCPWCIGFWVSGAGSLLVSMAYGLDYLMFALLWFATSTIVGLIGRIDSD
jgi:hypothetical protein